MRFNFSLTRKNIAFAELAFAQVTISIGIIIAKILLPIIPIFTLQCLRFFISALFILPFLLYSETNFSRYKKADYKRNLSPTSQTFWIFIFQALCGGFLFNIFILNGLQYSSATTASIITSTLPAVIAIFSVLFLKEQLKPVETFSILLAIFGLLIVIFWKDNSDFSHTLKGDFFIFMALIPEALFTIIAKWKKNTLPPLFSSFLNCFINALVFLPFAFFEQVNFSSIETSAYLLIIGYGVSAAFFFMFWAKGLQYHTTNIAAILTSIMPVSTVCLAVIFLDEYMNWPQFLGIFLVLTSIFIGSSSSFSLFKRAKKLIL